MDMSIIKKLRTSTGAGILDCQRALKACNNDLEEAKVWLRKEGITKAVNKQDRETAQGLISSGTQGGFGVMLEVNCETDFVSRNASFRAFFLGLVSEALEHKISSLDALLAYGNPSVKDRLLEQTGIIGEKIHCVRLATLEVSTGIVSTYIHGSHNAGNIGVLLALESEASPDVLAPLGRDIAMHIVASSPKYIRVNEVPASEVAAEEAIQRELLKNTDKPAEIIEKMLVGRMRLFYEEIILEEQKFVKDDAKTVKMVIQEAEKACGKPIHIAKFLRFMLGHGF